MAAMAGAGEVCETGLKGILALREAMRDWPGRDDASEHARYVDNAIIKFGTGGGFFRNHFAVFMAWAREQRPDLVSADSVLLAQQAADQWNGLSPTMQALVENPADGDLWLQATAQVDDIYHTEYTLFGQLGDTLLRSH
jgi:hypothetical protein